ncbi:MAG: hypothetical protein ABW046_11435 [Actinoplanes sp.]
MENASPAMFRPTWRQALGRGLYLGGLVSLAGLAIAALVTAVAMLLGDLAPPPVWLWVLVTGGPLTAGAVVAVPVGRRTGTQISAGGIRTCSAMTGQDCLATWNEVVDLRAERRGGRTVVSVYLDSGASLQLHAPYSGELFASDPRFEGKMFALSHLCRSHRFGGLPG